jgi:regulator of sigma E protease
VDMLSSAPALAQLQIGDTIHAVNGVPVTTWNAAKERIVRSDTAVVITTNRGTIRIPVGGNAGPKPQQVAGAIDYFRPPVIDSVIPGEPAARAGFLAGDSVAAVLGQPVRQWDDVVRIVTAAPGRALSFDVVRRGQHVAVAVTPKSVEATDEKGATTYVGKIGVAGRELITRGHVSVAQAFATGVDMTWSKATEVVQVVRDLLLGRLSVGQLGGPIAITRASVEAARLGLEWLLGLIAYLSVNVAVLNLFPIPILDGGQILLNVIESAKGSPFSMRTREYILRFGLVAIALLFVTVMYNDTRGPLAKMFGWIARLFS